MAEQTKPKKVRTIIREIQQEKPHILEVDNLLLLEVWLREGCTLDIGNYDFIEKGSSAGTILRARNYILNEDRRG